MKIIKFVIYVILLGLFIIYLIYKKALLAVEVLIMNALPAIFLNIYLEGNAFNVIIHGYFNYNLKLILNKVLLVQQEHHQLV